MPAYIFYGEDDFSLRRKLDTWKREFSKKYGSESVVLLERADSDENQMVSILEQSLSPSLFSSRKLVFARDYLPAKAAETRLGEYLEQKAASLPDDFFLVLWQTGKPDRRLGMIKKILNAATVNEFELPHGRMLNAWLKAYAKTLDLQLDEPAIEELAVYLGRDLYEEKKAGGRVIERKEAYNLWQAQSELEKLASYSKQGNVAAVRALVRPKVPENIFALTDEVVRKNQRGALAVVENLLGQPTADEKSATIKIIGLLAEQVRGMLLVKTLAQEGRSPDDIAEALGWSSGRVYILQKNAGNQNLETLKKLLSMLAEADYKMKSTDENPKLLISQFILAACAK